MFTLWFKTCHIINPMCRREVLFSLRELLLLIVLYLLMEGEKNRNLVLRCNSVIFTFARSTQGSPTALLPLPPRPPSFPAPTDNYGAHRETSKSRTGRASLPPTVFPGLWSPQLEYPFLSGPITCSHCPRSGHRPRPKAHTPSTVPDPFLGVLRPPGLSSSLLHALDDQELANVFHPHRGHGE